MYIVRSGLSENNKIYITTDLGNIWTNISGDLPNLPCWDLFVDPYNTEPNNTNHLYAGMDVGVYRSIDGGNSWQYVSEDIPLLPVWDFDYAEYGTYAKLRVGTYGRSAYETEWSLLPSAPNLIAPENNATLNSDTVLFVWGKSFEDVTKYWLELDTTDQFSTPIYVDSSIVDTTLMYYSLQDNQDYWWRVKALNSIGWGDFSEVGTFIVNITSVDEGNELPVEFSLKQNFPNPFNPVTNIKYSIKERSQVGLVLYDILGREIKVLINEEQDAGHYNIEFNAGNLASGIYLYKLKAGDFVETKKMVLMK
jgi:hypothetical protein